MLKNAQFEFRLLEVSSGIQSPKEYLERFQPKLPDILRLLEAVA